MTGLVNKATAANVRHVLPELLAENLVRGRGLLCRALLRSQAACPAFTGVFAAIVAVVNSKIPVVGRLLLVRHVIRIRRAHVAGDKPQPIPDLQPTVRSGLAGLVSAFRRVAQGQPRSGRVLACLAAAALLGRIARDLPTLCYAVVVGGLTIPAVYERLSMERYARMASLNLYRYELLYQSFSLTCYLSARDYLIQLLKEQDP